MESSIKKLNTLATAAFSEDSIRIRHCAVLYLVPSIIHTLYMTNLKFSQVMSLTQGHRMSWQNWDLNPGQMDYKAHVLNLEQKTFFKMQLNSIIMRTAVYCFSRSIT